MSELHQYCKKCNIQEIIDNNEEIMENIQRLNRRNKSLTILENCSPRFLDIEFKYQNYLLKFSHAYVSGSFLYRGESIEKWIINNTDIFGLLFLISFIGQ